jgi:hypothetical protein
MGKKDRRAHPRHDLETPAEITVEQAADEGGKDDQREHERVAVSYEINIEAGLRLGGQEVMRLTLVGKTIDISRGGMLIRVDQDVIPGARCDVHFLDSGGQIEPEETWGRVRRSIKAKKGFDLAVQFNTPLERLDV